MQNWAIEDETGILIQGRLNDLIHIWNTTMFSDEAYYRIYRRKKRDKKLIIKKYVGYLRLIQIITEYPGFPGVSYSTPPQPIFNFYTPKQDT